MFNELYHHGIKGQKHGVRRYQYEDGSLTPEGKERYRQLSDKYEKAHTKQKDLENRRSLYERRRDAYQKQANDYFARGLMNEYQLNSMAYEAFRDKAEEYKERLRKNKVFQKRLQRSMKELEG